MPTNKKKPIITTNRRKVQAYNDSSFIKKNFSIFPKPKGYDQALKRVGQDPSADYFPAPEQPYILKKEKKKIKKDIVPVPVKENIPKDTIPVVKPIIKPQVEKEPEPTVPKKLPGGSGPFARYPKKQGFFNKIKDSFNGLMQNRMVNGRNVNNITVTGPKYQNGTKKLSYKDWKNSLPDNLRTESKLYNLRGAYEGGLEPELNEDGFYHLGSRNPKTGEILKSPAHDTFKEAIDIERKLGYVPLVKPDGKVYTQNPEEQTYVSGAKSVKQYRGDENLPEAKNGMKKGCGCKHTKSKYKYGTGALTIPEGSAIVTANGGKNKKALMAYKKGNYKLLNNIIEDMPEDNKYKKVGGADALGVLKNPLSVSKATQYGAKYPWFKPFTQSNTEAGRISRTTGANTLLDPNDFYNQYNNLETFQKKTGKQYNDMSSLQGDIYDNMTEEQRASMWKKFGPTLKSNQMTKENFVDLKAGARTAYGLNTVDKTFKEKEDEKEEEIIDDKGKDDFKLKKGLNIPSLAEASAKASLLSQGVEDVPENYLKLGRYNYASQLDRTLRENAVAANAAKETIRDASAGNAGNFLSNVANVTGQRFNANAAAVGDDTDKRQNISNANVDLGNTEATTNTGLRNQYAQQRSANRGAYNNMLVSLGQSIDTATDASKLMSNQKGADNQRLAILKSMADSGNYDITTNPDGTMGFSVKQLPKTTTATEEPKKRGAKRLKTYKRR
jgi:hypothetical protein